MKTSFYFVLWIIIYPILDFLGVSSDYSFFVALIAIWGLSYVINKNMASIIAYDRFTAAYGICEIVAHGQRDRLSRKLITRIVLTAITFLYMAGMSALLIYQVMEHRTYDLVPLIIFGMITVGTIMQMSLLLKAKRALKDDDFERTLQLGFNISPGFYEKVVRMGADVRRNQSQRPKRYSVYLAVSLLFALLCTLLGLGGILLDFFITLAYSPLTSQSGLTASIYSLYGSLALIFGIKDIIDSLNAQKIGTTH